MVGEIVKVTITGADVVEGHLRRAPAEIRKSLVKTMTAIGFDWQGYVQRSKLSGQVLKQRSGWLSSHVHAETKDTGETVTTTVGVDTRAVPYAAIHEYGGAINVPEVQDKLMVFVTKQGDTVFTRKHRAYTVHMPERSYLRSSLRDKEQQYSDAIRRAVYEGAAA